MEREKYSELKLEAHFFKVSPGYLTASAATSATTGIYNTNADIVTTPVFGSNGSFFIVRHSDYTSEAATNYTLSLPTSAGNISIPQLGGSLTLNGRDSKVHLTDYPVGDSTLLYSTAEVFTWQTFENETVLVVYGGPNELHELAVAGTSTGSLVEGDGVTIQQSNSSVILQWTTSTDRRIVQVGDLYIYVLGKFKPSFRVIRHVEDLTDSFLDRNSAYNYWVPDLASGGAVIVNGPYLVRTAALSSGTLSLAVDVNATTSIEIIGVPSSATSLQINNATVTPTLSSTGSWLVNITYSPPTFSIPTLSSATWYTLDSLPELSSSYDDTLWPSANLTSTPNPIGRPLLTPVSLYASDYGFNTENVLFRGHFVASGNESALNITTQGGEAFGSSVWLNDTFLGSWAGDSTDAEDGTLLLTVPSLTSGAQYVITVLVDQMGLDENYDVGADEAKTPRGILSYDFASPITWKITGNLGGEDYADRVRGPLNEGGLFVERQGYHQPSPPLSEFSTGSSPFDGIANAGVSYYATNFTLALPSDEWDVPLSLSFTNNTAAAADAPYRAFIYVNGYQFGRYTSNVGPQTAFPVPEGVLRYNGENWLGIALWALGSDGASVPGLEWTVGATPALTGRSAVTDVEAPAWTERVGAY